MSVISIDPDELKSRAAEMQQCAQTHEDTMQNMHQLIESLNEEWSGKSQRAFLEKYASEQPEIAKFDAILRQYAAYLESAAEAMRDADRVCRQRIEAIG